MRILARLAPCLCIGIWAVLATPQGAWAYLARLVEIIEEYNAKALERGRAGGAYRGEEGILRIRPDAARSLGLAVPESPDYAEASGAYEESGRLYAMTVQTMKESGGETPEEERVRRVAELAAAYNRTRSAAEQKMRQYRGTVLPEKDQRLDKALCRRLMGTLLAECMTSASLNLRNALGCFYNRCDGVDASGPPLNSRNIRFVNHVFSEFTAGASPDTLSRLDLDRNRRNGEQASGSDWKAVLGTPESEYAPILASVSETCRKAGLYALDPLLFMAMMRQESNFKPREVSPMGAAGLAQIMPSTGRDLGMKNIFEPAYLEKARALLKRERELGQEAKALIPKIRSESQLETAGRARKLMLSSVSHRQQRRGLFERYGAELLKDGRDERLDPSKSILCGYRYLSEMLRLHEGDISLALAAYNAGPHRVKEYGGIPPFGETVTYRNRVLSYYWEYLRKMKLAREGFPTRDQNGGNG